MNYIEWVLQRGIELWREREETLKKRLVGRGTETEEKICQRLETAKRELPYAPKYDYQIVNGGDIEAAYQSLRDVFLKSTGEA